MTYSFTESDIKTVLIVILLGIILFIGLAWTQRSKSWKIDTFFLGGRNIGAGLSGSVFWGSSFSLANGIFYFAVLGYYFGLSAFWLQIPWVLAIWFLAWKLPLIMKETEKHTLHGFLGNLFGNKVRLLSSIVTTTGFLGAFAFEINVSTEILSKSLGIEGITEYTTIAVAIFAAAYCDIGGFKGSAKTDRTQNYLGAFSVAVIITMVFFFPDTIGIPKENLTLSSITDSLFDFSAFPIVSIVGILCYASTVNIVDMSNWQTISANSKTDEEGIKKLRNKMVLSSVWILLLPGLLGVFLGYIWKGVEINDTEIIPLLINKIIIVFQQVIPSGLLDTISVLPAIMLGIIILGLASTTLSTADSNLLSSSQTLSWDIIYHNIISKVDSTDSLSEKEHYMIVSKSRTHIYIMALLSALLFLLLRRFIGDETVFVAQFVIFGSVISLFPATIYGIWLRERKLIPHKNMNTIIFISLLLSYLSGILVFFTSMLFNGNSENSFSAYAWSPILTIFISSIVLIIGLVYNNIKIKYETNNRHRTP